MLRNTLLLLFAAFFRCCVSQTLNLGEILVNDQVHIGVQNIWNVVKNTTVGQDFWANTKPSVPERIVTEPQSFMIRNPASTCTLSQLVTNPDSGANGGLLYVTLCGVEFWVFEVSNQNKSEFKTRINLNSIASYTCNQIKFLSNRFYVVCSQAAAPQVRILDFLVTDANQGQRDITQVGGRPLTNPRLVFGEHLDTLGNIKAVGILYNAIGPNDYQTAAQVNTAVTNYYCYIYDLLSAVNTAPISSAIPAIGGGSKLLTMVSIGRNLAIAHYKNPAPQSVKLNLCSVGNGFNVGTCSELTTGFSLSTGTVMFGMNQTTGLGNIYMIEISKNLSIACNLNLVGVTAANSESSCKYSKAPINTADTTTFDSFSSADPSFGIAVYRVPAGIAIVEGLSPVGASALAFKYRGAVGSIVTSMGSNIMLIQDPRAVLINPNSTSDLILLATGAAGPINQVINYDLSTTNTSLTGTLTGTILSGLTQGTDIQSAGNMKGVLTYLQPLPYNRDRVKGNALTVTANAASCDTVVLNSNVVFVGFDTSATVAADRNYTVGDSLISVVTNSTNRTLLRYSVCKDNIHMSINSTCTFVVETEINGDAKWKYIGYLAVQNGSQPANAAVFSMTERILNIENLDNYLLVTTQDNSPTASVMLYCFYKRTNTITKYNFSIALNGVVLLDYKKDLYVSGISADGTTAYLYKSSRFLIANMGQIGIYNKIINPGDLCIKGGGLSVRFTPRLRLINQCTIGKEAFIEREFTVTGTRSLQNTFQTIQDLPAMTAAVQGCVAGRFSVFWETGKTKLYGVGAYRPDKFNMELNTFGMTTINSIMCYGGTDLVIMSGQDNTAIRLFLIFDFRRWPSAKRLPFVFKFPSNAITEFQFSRFKDKHLYLSYMDGTTQRYMKFYLGGPYVYTRTNTTAGTYPITVVADSGVTNQNAVTNVEFVATIMTNVVTNVNKIPISVGNHSLEFLFTITGPVFQVSSRNFNPNKSSIIPRVYSFGVINTTTSLSRYKVQGQVGAYLQSNATQTYLILNRDPHNLRYNWSLEYFADEQLAVAQSVDLNYAFSINEGFDAFDRRIYVHKTPLLPNLTDIGRGFIAAPFVSTGLQIYTLNTTHFLVTLFSSSMNTLIQMVVNFAPLTASLTQIYPVIQFAIPTAFSFAPVGDFRVTFYSEPGGLDLKFIIYNHVTGFDFSGPFVFNSGLTQFQRVYDLSCSQELNVSSTGFACITLSGFGTITEVFGQINPATKAVLLVANNVTEYTQYKDYAAISMKALKKFIVVAAASLNETTHALLIYKRRSYNGTGQLYSAITQDQFGYYDIDEIDYEIYEYNDEYRIYIQPNNSLSTYIFTVDDMKINIRDTDLTQLNASAVVLSNVSSFLVATAFFVGSSTSAGTGSVDTAAATSGTSSLLIVLIIFSVLVVGGALVAIGIVVYKKSGAINKATTYIDQPRGPDLSQRASRANDASNQSMFRSFEYGT